MNSPLLFEALENLSQTGYFQLLDIMPANPSLLDVLSEHHCKLFLPGCIKQLMCLRTSELDTPQKLQRALHKEFGFYRDIQVKLDLLLLWDLPNYLPNPVLSALIEYLLPYTNSNARLHCYIYTGQEMPDVPASYQLAASQKIWIEPQSERTTSAPVLYQEALHKLLTPFVVQRSILLSNGLQEYVLRKNPLNTTSPAL